MFDTNLVIVGNVLAAPEWRRIASSGALVANFRIASNSRRFDRENNCWVDGNNLRVRVTAWRRLAEGVASSITTGDPGSSSTSPSSTSTASETWRVRSALLRTP